jgi:CRP/FNR family transcriptional regulator, cyclic AMP receptor protein
LVIVPTDAKPFDSRPHADRNGTSWISGGVGRTNVLYEDVELGDAVPPDHREAAVRAAMAMVLFVEPGVWDAKADARRTVGGYGLLVLDGALVRRVGVRERVGAELLGPGDLLRPLAHDGEEATLPFEATWRVITHLRAAVLDRQWSYRMAAFPDVGIALAGRAMLRTRRLANTFVLSHYPRLDDRLHMLLWQLADRFGKVHPDGVHVELPLTHELLAHLVGARRPAVSAALSRLAKQRSVTRTGSLWVIHGEPPA